MRWILILLALAWNFGTAQADLISATFGTPQLLRPTRTRVQLESETTKVRVFYDYAEASATYEFRNLGAATTVTMGFPEAGPELDFGVRNPGFSPFVARVDGRFLKTRRQIAKRTPLGSEPEDVMRRVARVFFAAGQNRLITIKCRTKPFESYLFDGDLVYVFGGSRWLGRVVRSEISVEFKAPNAYILNASHGTTDYLGEKDVVPLETRGAICTFRRRDWRPAGKFELNFTTTLSPHWLTEKGIGRFEKTIVAKGKASGLEGAGRLYIRLPGTRAPVEADG